MKSKICARCKREKEVTEFCKHKRMKDGLQSACKACMNDSYKRSRNKKKKHYKNTQQLREQKNKKRFDAWKHARGCSVCNEDEPICLDLHHLTSTDKENEVANMVRKVSWKTLMTEVNKCIVVCRNCHAKIHAKLI